MSLGIVGGWMFVILGLSYYVRGRIGPQRWRKLHRFTALAWVLGVVHALGVGTDAGRCLVPARGRDGRPARRGACSRDADPGGGDMRFNCFGTRCGVWGAGAADARGQLEAWHVQFSRFRPDSELTRLNADPRATVPVSATMARLLEAVARSRRRDRRPGRRDAGARDRGRGLPRRPGRAAAARRRAGARPAAPTRAAPAA